MNYKEIYRRHFGYGEQDFIPSELSGSEAADIHHIIYRSHGGTDRIENLIALTRVEHNRAHDRSKNGYSEKILTEKHLLFIEANENSN